MRKIIQRKNDMPVKIVGIAAVVVVAATAISWIGIIVKRSK